MMLWLHEQGYNFFNIPKLTYPEIGMLAEACSRKSKKQENANKRMERQTQQSRFRRR
jgi:hypothetical protein